MTAVLSPIAAVAGAPTAGRWIDLATAHPAFRPCPEVCDALDRLGSERGLGYPSGAEKVAFDDALAHWQRLRHGWDPAGGSLLRFAGATQALAAVVEAATPPGSPIACHAPTYPGFDQVALGLGRRLVDLPVDASPDDVAELVAATGARLLVLGNPHNPTGRSFDEDRLAALVDGAQRGGAIVVADEVHADLATAPHVPLASLAGGRPVASIVSPGKAFALAGLGVAALVGAREVVDPVAGLSRRLLGFPSVASIVAGTAAWNSDGRWVDELRNLVATNRRVLRNAIAPLGWRDESDPHTMLAWIAVGSTAEPDEDLVGLAARARVMVGDGRRFGPTGDGHLRVCLARPSDWFIEGVERLVTLGRPPRR